MTQNSILWEFYENSMKSFFFPENLNVSNGSHLKSIKQIFWTSFKIRDGNFKVLLLFWSEERRQNSGRSLPASDIDRGNHVYSFHIKDRSWIKLLWNHRSNSNNCRLSPHSCMQWKKEGFATSMVRKMSFWRILRNIPIQN